MKRVEFGITHMCVENICVTKSVIRLRNVRCELVCIEIA